MDANPWGRDGRPGRVPLAVAEAYRQRFTTRDAEGRASQEYRTLFLQELLRRGVLGQSFVVSAAHTETDIEQTMDAVNIWWTMGYGRGPRTGGPPAHLQVDSMSAWHL